MADTGWLTGGSLAEDTSHGTLAWTNPANARVEDESVADNIGDDGIRMGDSYFLKAYNFGANIPAGATPDGIEVRVKKAHTGSAGTNVKDAVLKLAKAGTPAGDSKADTVNSWVALTLTWKEYGAANDLWGNSLTDEDVNNSNFGVAFSAFCQGGARPGILGVANVDCIQIKIHYTEAPAAGAGQLIMIDPA